MKIDHIALYCLDLEGIREFFIRYFNGVSNEMYHNPKTRLKTYTLSFQDFPSASLGWMMYIGMAVAKMWDTEWEVMEQREQSDARIDSAESRQNSTEGQIYSKIEDLYAYMRDKRGYDQMDEYISEEVLLLQGVDYTILEKVTGECASRVYNALMH